MAFKLVIKDRTLLSEEISEQEQTASEAKYAIPDEIELDGDYRVSNANNISSLIFRNALSGVDADTPSPKKVITNDNVIKNISFDQS